MPTQLEIAGTLLFACAVLHTFLTSVFQRWAARYPEGSVKENLFHLLGEVEVVFGLWAGLFVIVYAALEGLERAITYVDHLDYTEPLFVFAIMAIASTKPVVNAAKKLMLTLSYLVPLPGKVSMYWTCLVAGPLLGSFITEPAAMTVTALLLRDLYFSRETSERLKYVTLAVLFVNISIGGVLTPYAAPPVLMVAGKWNWTAYYMLTHFGYKSVIAVVMNACLATAFLWKELTSMQALHASEKLTGTKEPLWLKIVHLFFLALIVISSHHPAFFMGLFMFFLGINTITSEYQGPLKIRQSLLVAYFLAGLIVLGPSQAWWLKHLLAVLDSHTLFLGASMLTAITDNAALTFLGSQVENISEVSKYALVAGAVSGGGLTVIANAPNLAGFSILQKNFGASGISPLNLFLHALVPTVISMGCFWWL